MIHPVHWSYNAENKDGTRMKNTTFLLNKLEIYYILCNSLYKILFLLHFLTDFEFLNEGYMQVEGSFSGNLINFLSEHAKQKHMKQVCFSQCISQKILLDFSKEAK